jgi:hypothetical protein
MGSFDDVFSISRYPQPESCDGDDVAKTGGTSGRTLLHLLYFVVSWPASGPFSWLVARLECQLGSAPRYTWGTQIRVASDDLDPSGWLQIITD